PCQFSDDDKYLIFNSSATNLVTGFTDTNANIDLFRRDLQAGTTALVNKKFDGTATSAQFTGAGSMSGNGRFISFQSQSNDLIPGFASHNGGCCSGIDGFLVDMNPVAGTVLVLQLTDRP